MSIDLQVQDDRRTDVISQILRSVHLEGTVYFEARVEAPWGVHIPRTGVANFHLVTSGEVFIDTGIEGALRLSEGDAIVFPHGLAHTLSHEPGQDGVDGTTLLQQVDDDGIVRLDGAQSDATSFICGHFAYETELRHPLFQALPEMVHAPSGHHPGWKAVAEMAVDSSKRLSPGSQALTDRLAEVLVIELLTGLSGDGVDFFAALSDPTVSAALHAMHERPDHDWTVGSLASHVSVSRSTLASRFTELVGESPIRYLTRWRMHRATELLRDTSKSAGEVGHAVGYRSPFAFTKAFTRELGVPPSEYRRA